MAAQRALQPLDRARRAIHDGRAVTMMTMLMPCEHPLNDVVRMPAELGHAEAVERQRARASPATTAAAGQQAHSLLRAVVGVVFGHRRWILRKFASARHIVMDARRARWERPDETRPRATSCRPIAARRPRRTRSSRPTPRIRPNKAPEAPRDVRQSVAARIGTGPERQAARRLAAARHRHNRLGIAAIRKRHRRSRRALRVIVVLRFERRRGWVDSASRMIASRVCTAGGKCAGGRFPRQHRVHAVVQPHSPLATPALVGRASVVIDSSDVRGHDDGMW